ncbi:hypothetical protein RHGRI_030175 [Rhododendron griersonianum]|uniref:Uncharacterized protein n=1 Tax=Rhododendron griersonianum TaxID=479676 RepID=A0AAV6IQ57_9ERIC|nr:hypothetical protein RHGRI_030175 [Rhododendron griersonianum]
MTFTYVVLSEGHSKHGNSEDFDNLSGEKGLVLDYASYTPLLRMIKSQRIVARDDCSVSSKPLKASNMLAFFGY